MPKNAENEDFLSKFPGIDYDLSFVITKLTYLGNLMSISINYDVSFYMCCFCMWFDKKFLGVNV